MPFSMGSTTCTDWRWYLAGVVTSVDSELNLLVLQLASRAGEAVTCAAFPCGAGCWRGNYGGANLDFAYQPDVDVARRRVSRKQYGNECPGPGI